MIVSEIPIKEFLPKIKAAAHQDGYDWIMVLAARELDAHNAYRDLAEHWSSFHSLTGRQVLFLFAGNSLTNLTGVVKKDSCHSETAPNLGILPVKIGNHTESIELYRYTSKTELRKILDSHTDAINDLKEYYHLKESDIPSLIVYATDTGQECTDRILLPLAGPQNLYQLIKEVLTVIEDCYDQYGGPLRPPAKPVIRTSKKSPLVRFRAARDALDTFVRTTDWETPDALLADIRRNENPAHFMKQQFDHQTIASIRQYSDLLQAYPDIAREEAADRQRYLQWNAERDRYEACRQAIAAALRAWSPKGSALSCGTPPSSDLEAGIRKALQNIMITPLYRGCNEDELNRAVRNQLSLQYHIKDQTQQGSSASGNGVGEPDLLICDSSDQPLAIYEGLVLSCLNRRYFKKHLEKVLLPTRYNPLGCKAIYVAIYGTAKNFQAHWRRICRYLSEYDFEYPIQIPFTECEHRYTELREGSVTLLHNSDRIVIHFFLINMYTA